MKTEFTEPEIPADLVGKRVSCDGERATVLYVGPVPPTTGEVWFVIHVFQISSQILLNSVANEKGD